MYASMPSRVVADLCQLGARRRAERVHALLSHPPAILPYGDQKDKEHHAGDGQAYDEANAQSCTRSRVFRHRTRDRAEDAWGEG